MLRFSPIALLLITSLNANAITLGNSLLEMASAPGREVIDVHTVLAQISKKENRNLPRLINEEVRLDRLIAGQGKHLIRQFTLLGEVTTGGGASTSKNHEKRLLKSDLCNDKSLSIYLRNGVSVTNELLNKQGQIIEEINVSSTDCRQKI
jgi:hypothetical protein